MRQIFDKFNLSSNLIPKIHEEGTTTIMIISIISIFCMFFSRYLFLLSSLLSALSIYFFRDPTRMVPQGENLMLSPADGLIVDVKENCSAPINSSSDEKFTKISIFLNIVNVHVNRIPISGTVGKTHYHRGKFLNASFDKASDENERQTVEIKKDEESFFVVQIAGLIARRIVCSAKENEEVKGGNRFGIIKFGSRVDLFIPEKYNDFINVTVGQTAVGGETIICDLDSVDNKEKKFKKI